MNSIDYQLFCNYLNISRDDQTHHNEIIKMQMWCTITNIKGDNDGSSGCLSWIINI